MASDMLQDDVNDATSFLEEFDYVVCTTEISLLQNTDCRNRKINILRPLHSDVI